MKLDLTFKKLDETYNFLQGYNLFAFQHRVVLRLSLFAHKIINIKQAYVNLKNQTIYNSDRKIEYKLCETTKTTLCLPVIKNHYGELTFKYFINLILEKICIKIINLSFIDFRKSILNNLKNHCKIFIEMFKKFDIIYKKTCFIHLKKTII